jgi:iron complex outermembrane receptor protein
MEGKMSKIPGHFNFTRALLMGTALGLVPNLASAAEAVVGLENIVVTAQKREENLQVVPVAVTALTSQTLQDMRFENFRNMDALAPGLTVRESAGGNQQPVFTIRGVYSSSSFGSDPGVALYIDGVYIPSLLGADLDMADVERIEVLRGPQGTLFGRNAIGGAVNVISKEPSGKFQGHQQFSYGNLNQFRSKTSIDLPAMGILSAQATYLHDERDGDVKNLGAGTVWHYGPATGGIIGDRVSPKTLGGHTTDAVSAALKLQTDSGVKAVYRFSYTHKNFVPDATGILQFDTSTPFNAFIQSIWAAQDPATRTPISATRPDAVNNWYTTTGVLRSQNHSLTISAPITDSISIKNVAAYSKLHVDSNNQLDGLGGQLAAPGIPILILDNSNQSTNKTLSDELQVNIDTHFVKSTVGYLHYYSKVIQGGLDHIANTPYGSGLLVAPSFYLSPPYTNFTAPADPGALLDDIRTKSDAIYTQNEIHILPKLDLVLGGRYSWDRRDGIDNSPTPGGPGTTVAYRDSRPTYLIGLNYKVSDDIFTYVKMSSAYISGGQVANVKFDPSTAKSYEIGAKSDLLDHRLRLNLAAFLAKYTALQIFTNPLVGCAGVPGVALTSPLCIVNGGNLKAKGFEAEATLVPTAGLTLSGNLAYTDTYFTSVAPYLRAADGTFESVYTPAWTASLSAQYTGPDIDSLKDAHLIARIDANYSSSAFGPPNSIRAVEDASKIPARWLVNARVGLGGFQVGGTEVEVAGFVNNLTDNKSIVYDFNASANIPVNYQTARMYGIDLNIGF